MATSSNMFVSPDGATVFDANVIKKHFPLLYLYICKRRQLPAADLPQTTRLLIHELLTKSLEIMITTNRWSAVTIFDNLFGAAYVNIDIVPPVYVATMISGFVAVTVVLDSMVGLPELVVAITTDKNTYAFEKLTTLALGGHRATFLNANGVMKWHDKITGSFIRVLCRRLMPRLHIGLKEPK